ncbi:aminoacyl-tRNA hydrolase [Buchnera aphidicola (Formosaphis micheliae)]|uniref:aminoacyl-tRNA hydrolase n=1 Tax=Buchnera aphidicola TaxID=9 RepID=UPI0031B89AA3
MIVGLANPINEYNHTRHNVGAWFLQVLAQHQNKYFIKEKQFFGFTSHISFLNKKIFLLIPNIYMNINGASVLAMSSYYKISLNNILIVHDELDLLPGKIKFKVGRGHNGHNGLRNIIKVFSEIISFSRISIGIGRPTTKKEVAKFVLSSPTQEEHVVINKIIKQTVKELIFT